MIDYVVVGGVRYQVIEINDLQDDDGQAYYGRVWHRHLRIELDSDQARPQKIQALLHEALHGLFHQTGHFDIEEEERVVQMLGCQLPKFLRDNPELVQLLLSDEDDDRYMPPRIQINVNGHKD